jgi:aminopeptidase N
MVYDDEMKGLDFHFDDQKGNEALGRPLVITLRSPLKVGEKTAINFTYATEPDADAIQWLTPEMTLGKKHPFMYTQGEAIHARTLLPCQDSPSVKVKVKGKITVPKPMVGLIAGIQKLVIEEGDFTTFVYEVPNPIPTYLIAIAAGNLEKRQISHRSSVWAEPEIVEKAQHEFEDTETYITTVNICLTLDGAIPYPL